MTLLPQDLLRELSKRADDPAAYVDMREFTAFRRYPPLDSAELRAVESRLGFALAESLAQLYSEVANGGFGPGYGVLGVGSGAPNDQGDTAEDVYVMFMTPDPVDPSWRWRTGVVPFCYWGCVVYSCITPDGQVIGFDEGRWVDDALPLETWLRQWIDGSLNQPVAHA